MESQSLNPYAAIYRPSFYVYSDDHHYYPSPPPDLPLLLPSPHQLQPFCSVLSHHFQLSSPAPVAFFPEFYYYLPPPAAFYSAAASACWPRKEVDVVYVTADDQTILPTQYPPHHSQKATLTLLGDDGKDFKNPKEDVEMNDEGKISKAVIKNGPRKPPAAPRKCYIAKRSQVENLQLDPTVLEDSRSTVMIKNIPNKFTKKMLLDILDEHCFQKNEEIWKGKDSAIQSEFDFLYLPIDFKSGSNKGYAFVNFTSGVAARRLYDAFHDIKWNTYGSKKTCQIVYARIQGKDALVQHFWNSTFPCSRSDYLPISFTPPRGVGGGGGGGAGEMSQECTIGRMARNCSLIKSGS